MPCRANRVAHVVQAVEETHQVMVMPRIVLGRRLFEAHPLGKPRLLGALIGGRDGRCVIVITDKSRGRKRLGHDQGRSPVSATDISHLSAGREFVDNAVQGR
ncbi:hypothetical protein D3C71_1785480 [compost metagenome]